MNTLTLPSWLLLRLTAPLVWRREAKIAAKLEGFAASEAGSALDMLKAAEITDDPGLRRLFFRHAMDEARHAQLFRGAARALSVDARIRGSEYALIHATRQNLLARMGLVRFVAFVHVAEQRGALQFSALERHFADREELASLFARIGKDETFHIKYSGHLLDLWRREGRASEVRWALLRVRAERAWDAWRRSGRVLGDLVARGFLGLVYFLVLPVFALVQRAGDPEQTGWKSRKESAGLEAARSQK